MTDPDWPLRNLYQAAPLVKVRPFVGSHIRALLDACGEALFYTEPAR